MNILERTKLLERVAECDRKSAEAVALVKELSARIAALEGKRGPGRPRATEGYGSGREAS